MNDEKVKGKINQKNVRTLAGRESWKRELLTRAQKTENRKSPNRKSLNIITPLNRKST